MGRTIVAALLLGLGLGHPAAAHMVWLERDGTTVLLFFGEPAENLRERSGGALDRIASPRLVGSDATAVRGADHVAFSPVTGPDVRATEDGLAPRDDRQNGGRTRTVFLAREGRSDPATAMELELAPAEPGGTTFTLTFRGQKLPKTEIDLIGPPGWSKTLRTDAEGRVTLPLPWSGRYVAEVQHQADSAGGSGPGAYDRTRYVSTLSFVVTGGIPWPPSR
ncbi:MAG: hypothetical protein WDN25_19095 [Acetobacteraceae bacterium]